MFLAEAHGGQSAPLIPITLTDGEPYTWLVGSYDDEYLITCFGTPPLAVHHDSLNAMRNSWFVMIVDPVWGRNDLLWPTLTAALVPKRRAGRLAEYPHTATTPQVNRFGSPVGAP